MIMLVDGVHTQVLYLISAFQVLPAPGFDVLDSILVYLSVSPHMSLPVAPTANHIPDIIRVFTRRGLSSLFYCENHPLA